MCGSVAGIRAARPALGVQPRRLGAFSCRLALRGDLRVPQRQPASAGNCTATLPTRELSWAGSAQAALRAVGPLPLPPALLQLASKPGAAASAAGWAPEGVPQRGPRCARTALLTGAAPPLPLWPLLCSPCRQGGARGAPPCGRPAAPGRVWPGARSRLARGTPVEQRTMGCAAGRGTPRCGGWQAQSHRTCAAITQPPANWLGHRNLHAPPWRPAVSSVFMYVSIE